MYICSGRDLVSFPFFIFMLKCPNAASLPTLAAFFYRKHLHGYKLFPTFAMNFQAFFVF